MVCCWHLWILLPDKEGWVTRDSSSPPHNYRVKLFGFSFTDDTSLWGIIFTRPSLIRIFRNTILKVKVAQWGVTWEVQTGVSGGKNTLETCERVCFSFLLLLSFYFFFSPCYSANVCLDIVDWPLSPSDNPSTEKQQFETATRCVCISYANQTLVDKLLFLFAVEVSAMPRLISTSQDPVPSIPEVWRNPISFLLNRHFLTNLPELREYCLLFRFHRSWLLLDEVSYSIAAKKIASRETARRFVHKCVRLCF